jgi:hypothetical protein
MQSTAGEAIAARCDALKPEQNMWQRMWHIHNGI